MFQDVQADISEIYERKIYEKLDAVRPISELKPIPKDLPDLDGLPTDQRLKTVNDLELPRHKNISTCVVIPMVKPLDYNVTTRKNALENSLNRPQLEVLAAYVYGNIIVRASPKTVDLDATCGSFGSRCLVNDDEMRLTTWIEFVRAPFAPEILDNLERMTSACEKDLGLTADKIGKLITNSTDKRRQLGAFEGYFKGVSQQLLENDRRFFDAIGISGVGIMKRLIDKRQI